MQAFWIEVIRLVEVDPGIMSWAANKCISFEFWPYSALAIPKIMPSDGMSGVPCSSSSNLRKSVTELSTCAMSFCGFMACNSESAFCRRLGPSRMKSVSNMRIAWRPHPCWTICLTSTSSREASSEGDETNIWTTPL